MQVKIPFDVMQDTIRAALLQAGLSPEQAEICARIHTESSADGVESHGLNRIPRFVDYVLKGWVNPKGQPECIGSAGAVERYDGHLGIGVTNALFCTDRAMELARSHGIGCVSIRNTTHWMRGGTYAWRMAREGFVGINWTNTESCMPLWGSDTPGVGNNPFCMAVPRESGPIVLDMAMSQYAYGKLGMYRLAGKELPYPGGFDRNGVLTSDPAAIEESRRILPTGYWKGSGMAITLDLAAAMLANGYSGADMDAEGKGSCTSCCQVFLAVNPYLFGGQQELQAMLDRRVAAADSSHPEKEGGSVTCPGERTASVRERSMQEGIKADETIWHQVQAIAGGNMQITDIS